MNIRAAAARVICQVVQEGQSLSPALTNEFQKINVKRDQAFLQALCFAACRNYFFLEKIVDLLLEKPLKEKDFDVKALLIVGLTQLEILQMPAHAAVAETVSAAKGLRKMWCKAFVNATLRNFIRKRESLLAACEDDLIAKYNHPEWMIDAISSSYPNNWQDILIANNQHPPFSLRVNQRHINRANYIALLKAKGIIADIIPETQSGIILSDAMDVAKLPNFANGDVSVQDGAAQLAAELLELKPNLKVLDACAAPGGKTAHILEIEPSIDLIAVEKDASRVSRIEENLQRLKFSVNCLVADAADVDKWWDGNKFDRILLDAPCSATGVIRRHPDIKLLRDEADIENVSKEQWRLLTKLWPLLKINGIFLYATCSIFPQENTELLEKFLQAYKDAKEEKIQADWGVACKVGRQIFPGSSKMDGFYYCKLRKVD